MNPLKRAVRWIARRSAFQIGVVFLAAFVLVVAVAFNRNRLEVALKSGEKISADFPYQYKLETLFSKVKVAGVRVGTVTAIKERPDGVARVEMKVAPGTRAKLGTNPTAMVRPATLLSGYGPAQYVDLRPGGEKGRAPALIPMKATRPSVELDHVLQVLDDEARQGLSGTVRGLDAALADGGAEALGRLLETAPPALRPAVPVLQALAGEEQGDLTRVVAHVGQAAQVLTAHDGELEAVVNGLATVASRLQARTPQLTATIDGLPGTLTEAKTALAALKGTLVRLQDAVPAGRQAAAQLRPLLERAGPVLAEAHAVLADLRPLVADVRPLLDSLLPTVRGAQRVLTDLDGPVLQRVNDNVIPTLNSPYQSSDTVMYQDLGYVTSAAAGVARSFDDAGPYAIASGVGGAPEGGPYPPVSGRHFFFGRMR